MAVLRRGNRSSLNKKKNRRYGISIELSRLRIESFFCLSIPFLPYHGSESV